MWLQYIRVKRPSYVWPFFRCSCNCFPLSTGILMAHLISYKIISDKEKNSASEPFLSQNEDVETHDRVTIYTSRQYLWLRWAGIHICVASLYIAIIGAIFALYLPSRCSDHDTHYYCKLEDECAMINCSCFISSCSERTFIWKSTHRDCVRWESFCRWPSARAWRSLVQSSEKSVVFCTLHIYSKLTSIPN
jgi:hypothetical protein